MNKTKKKLLKKLKKEKKLTEWAIDLQRTGRQDRFKELKKKGLI
ncbi:MAG TPA: hypothetical protein VJJ23_02015 [Candidatus Nanoarchaeia archaeon]|nr:hypothetical protein [Candidatus Nanoarchaeia archaeon]